MKRHYQIESSSLLPGGATTVWKILLGGEEILRDLAGNPVAAQRAARAARRWIAANQIEKDDNDAHDRADH